MKLKASEPGLFFLIKDMCFKSYKHYIFFKVNQQYNQNKS